MNIKEGETTGNRLKMITRIDSSQDNLSKCANDTCSRETRDKCTKCNVPFCSMNCMVLGYYFHAQKCLLLPVHSKEKNNSNITIYSEPKKNENLNDNPNTENFSKKNTGDRDITNGLTFQNHLNYSEPVDDQFTSKHFKYENDTSKYQSGQKENHNEGLLANEEPSKKHLYSNIDFLNNNFKKLAAVKSDSKKSETQLKTNNSCIKSKDFIYPRVKLAKGIKFQIILNEVNVTNEPGIVSFRVVEEQAALDKLETHIAEEAHFADVTNLKEKDKYIFSHDRLRVQIMSLSPLKVRYVDHSANSFFCNVEDLKECPYKYSNIYGFSYRGKFINNPGKHQLEKIVREKKSLWVEIVRKEQYIWILGILDQYDLIESASLRQGEKHEKPKINYDAVSLNPILDYEFQFHFNPSEQCLADVIVTTLIDDKCFYVNNSQEFSYMRTIIEKSHMTTVPVESFSLGMICLDWFKNQWLRAKVIQVNPLQVFYLDLGKIEMVQKKNLKLAPHKISNIRPLAVKVKLYDGDVNLCHINEGESIRIRLLGQDDYDKSWLITTKESRKVLLTLSRSEYEYWALPWKLYSITKKIQSLPNIPLKTPLCEELLCLMLFENIKFRVRVTSVNPLKIDYLDFGGSEEIHEKNLFELPEKWQNYPPLAYKIKLKSKLLECDKPNEPVTIIRNLKDNSWRLMLH